MPEKIINSDIFKLMEEWAPKHLAYDWDNIGLQVGSYSRQVKKVMVTLDVVEDVIDEAIEKGVDMIIAHHPLLFKPLKQINTDTHQGRMVRKLITHNISVYAAHTNLDSAVGGVNDLLAEPLNLQSSEVLVDSVQEGLFKIAVFVPLTHTEAVINALNKVGAGHIGDYSHCTFQTKGHGTFKPLEGTEPYIGTQDKIEKVEEVKIETIVHRSILSKAINEMIQAHPYEEVAYDIFPLENQGKIFGLGRIGELKEKVTLQSLIEHIKKIYDVPTVRVTGDLTKEVKKVAILGGSGEKYISTAKKKGADVYITGDMTFHSAQDAEYMGLSVIDPGHHIEKVMKQGTQNYLQKKLNTAAVDIIVSEIDTEPFKFV